MLLEELRTVSKVLDELSLRQFVPQESVKMLKQNLKQATADMSAVVAIATEIVKLPDDSLRKACLVGEYWAKEAEAIREQANKIRAHMPQIRQHFARKKFFSLTQSPLASESKKLYKLLERFIALENRISVDAFSSHIYKRYRLNAGRIWATFVFFRKETHPLNLLLENELFIQFATHFGNSTFESAYKQIANWFFRNVILNVLESQRHLFESYYGPNYHLNITVYFTAMESGSQTLMFVRNVVKGRSTWVTTGSFDRRDLRVFVIITTIINEKTDELPAIFFHELIHLLHEDNRVKPDVLSKINNEGLATLAEFYANPQWVIKKLGSYNSLIAEVLSSPIVLNEFVLRGSMPYDYGLHMWLVIYISKLNIQPLPNLYRLSPDIAMLMHGQYEPYFRAWLLRFKHMNDSEFLTQYLAATKKLGLKSLIKTGI